MNTSVHPSGDVSWLCFELFLVVVAFFMLRQLARDVFELLHRRSTWRSGLAKVIALQKLKRRRGHTWARTLRFEGPEGASVTFIDVNWPSFLSVGDEVAIRYDPSQPRSAMLDTPRAWLFSPVFLLFSSFIFLGLAWWMFRQQK